VTPSKPRPDLKSRREREILEAAAAVFAERGFRGTRIADVAVRAGIGKGTVYEYFRSKEALFMRLFHWYTTEAFESMADMAAEQGGSPLTVLRRSCDSLLESCREMQDLYPLTMEFWSASTSPEFREELSREFRELYVRFRATIAGLLRTGIDQGEVDPDVQPEAVAGVLVGALDGIFLQAWFNPEFDAVAAGRHFLDVLPGGIAASGRGDSTDRPDRKDPS
jgi:AcrR family transcriptional regulator